MSERADEGRFVVSGDIRLWTVVAGSGPRVLLLHGGPGLDHHFVAPLAAELASAFEVWTPDLPGHGRSARDDGKPPGLRQLEDKLVHWIAHMPFNFDVIAGHSLGAFLVRELLRHRRISAPNVVLISPATARQTDSSVSKQTDRPIPSLHIESDVRREVRSHVAVECAGSIPAEVDELVEQSRLIHVSRYHALLRNLHKSLTGPPRRFEPNARVLVLVGEDDLTTPVTRGRMVAEAIKGARFVTLSGLGHYPFMQDPQRVGETIREFLSTAD